MTLTQKHDWKARMWPATIAALLLACGAAYAGDKKKDMDEKSTSQVDQIQQQTRDAWLDGKLESALLFNQHLNSFEIDTEVKHGTAYLTGAVDSDIDKDLAGEVAKSIEGIEEVKNKLTVDREAATAARESESFEQRSEWRQALSDATMTAMVKSRLLFNDNTSGMDINVDSRNGVVTLSGTVESDEEAALAAEIAGNIEDVRDVENRLQVNGEERG